MDGQLIKAWEGLPGTVGLNLTVGHLPEGVYVLKEWRPDGRPASLWRSNPLILAAKGAVQRNHFARLCHIVHPQHVRSAFQCPRMQCGCPVQCSLGLPVKGLISLIFG